MLFVISCYAAFALENTAIAVVAVGTSLSMLAFVAWGAASRESQKGLLRLAFLGSVVVFVASMNSGGFNGTTAFWLICLPLVALEFRDYRYVLRSIAAGLILFAALLTLQLAFPGAIRSYSDAFRWRAAIFDHFGLFATVSLLVVTAYRSRQRLNNEISSQNILLNRLLQILGHDLVNSISVIQMHHRRLAARYSGGSISQEDAQLVRTVATMGKHLELLEGLVTKSKQLARWQAGTKLETQPVHLLEAVTIAWQLCQIQAERKDVRLEFSHADLDTWVLSDQSLLVHEGLQNFLSNAIKFSNRSDTIWIHTHIAEGEVLVAIEDAGSGIPIDVVNGLGRDEKLRTSAGTSGEKGTGFGLRIAVDMLGAAGTKVTVFNKTTGLPQDLGQIEPKLAARGRGTLVLISLPVCSHPANVTLAS